MTKTPKASTQKTRVVKTTKPKVGVDAKVKIPHDSAITMSQRRVLEFMLRGMTSNEIAWSLGLSPFTVNNHAQAIYEAYNATSRAQVIAVHLARAERKIKSLERKG